MNLVHWTTTPTVPYDSNRHPYHFAFVRSQFIWIASLMHGTSLRRDNTNGLPIAHGRSHPLAIMAAHIPASAIAAQHARQNARAPSHASHRGTLMADST